MRVECFAEPSDAIIEEDYTPVTVRWIPREKMGGFLWKNFIHPTEEYNKGYYSIQLEPLTGEVSAFVVEVPPVDGPGAGFVPPVDLPTVVSGIRVDRTPWDLNPDLTAQVEQLVEVVPLTAHVDEHFVHFGFSSAVAVKKVMAGVAGFTVTADDELTGVCIERGATLFGSVAPEDLPGFSIRDLDPGEDSQPG